MHVRFGSWLGIVAILALCLHSDQAEARSSHAARSSNDRDVTNLSSKSGGVALQQVHFVFEAGRVLDSDWGRIAVSSDKIGVHSSGYINAFIENDASTREAYSWVVENMFVRAPIQCQSGCSLDHDHSNEIKEHIQAGSEPRGRKKTPSMTRYFDLRPNEESLGRVDRLRAIVLFSKNPLPNVDEVWRMLSRYRPSEFAIEPVVVNAEGDDGELEDSTRGRSFPEESPSYHLVGVPPAPTSPPFEPSFDFAAPVEVFQDTWPNVEAGKNQCVPMAHANAFRYLESQFNALPMQWDIPHYAIRGYGRIDAAGDVSFWTAIPENSVVAQVDQITRRLAVKDLNTGDGSSRCQNLRGAFGYINMWGGDKARVKFRHQGGGELYGFGDGKCSGYSPANIGEYTSVREGEVPTWEWIFDQLQKGRSVVMTYGRYDSKGERTGGHMLRVYGAAKYNGKNYLYTLDDGKQGDNFEGTRLQTFAVADTENSGEDGDGETDNMLNIDGQSWEIEFALSTEAKPNLLIP